MTPFWCRVPATSRVGCTRGAAWQRSLSPKTFVARVPTTTKVFAITGAADENTFPALAQDYVAELAQRGVPARFVAVDGAGHGFSGVAAATRAAVQAMAKE